MVLENNNTANSDFLAQTMQANVSLMQHAWEYTIDAWQKTFLFHDVLRKRGNNFIDHLKKGNPPVLTFKYKIISDGRNLARPVNYALARILPKPGNNYIPGSRPVVIIDPRAGHGPGIGGFKEDSEIGIALKNRHPVYFILFYSNPVLGQTINDVLEAEIAFLEIVAKLHSDADKPAVIGNCQAGWATALLAANRPDLTGPIILNGAPLSYWSGKGLNNPMRFRGGLFGGNWLASMLADLGNGRFDGAHLVAGFEDLNPANTYWKKQYNLYAAIDTQEDRYLAFERWWGGFFFMTKEEIHFITESLFVGNRLEQGKLSGNNGRADLKNIEDPIIVFASHGDNITAPQQALNWIARTWGSDENIKNQGRIIIYLIHGDIGHLGIFVSSKIANKEHKELFKNIDVFEYLAPGLYEMIVDDEKNAAGRPDIQFQSRKLQDIADLNDLVGEKEFEIVNAVSKANENLYNTLLSPFINIFSSEYSAAFIRKCHPLRLERYLGSDLNPAMIPVKTMSSFIRKNRKPAAKDNPFSKIEKHAADCLGIMLDFYRDQRDSMNSMLFYSLYGNPVTNAFFTLLEQKTAQLETEMEEIHQKSALSEHDMDLESWKKLFQTGDFIDGVARILMLISGNKNVFTHNELKTIKNIRSFHDSMKKISRQELLEKLKQQAAIVHKSPVHALDGLAAIFKTPSDRNLAFEIANHIAIADNDDLSSEDINMLDRISEQFEKNPVSA